ncbi:hypothetical protein ACH5RR_032658 [Cinchona calisaya]|uniref:Uncharacterized protein n=1 Tax=Cinchona calisaya TaxID=153742 RepID=A0ABD2YIS5_9GENT
MVISAMAALQSLTGAQPTSHMPKSFVDVVSSKLAELKEKQWKPKGLLLHNDTIKTLEKDSPSGLSIKEKSAAPVYVVEKPTVAESLNDLINAVPNQPVKSKIDAQEQCITVPEKLTTLSNVEHVVAAAHSESCELVATLIPNTTREDAVVVPGSDCPRQVKFRSVQAVCNR